MFDSLIAMVPITAEKSIEDSMATPALEHPTPRTSPPGHLAVLTLQLHVFVSKSTRTISFWKEKKKT